MGRHALQASPLGILAHDELYRLGLQRFAALTNEEMVSANGGAHG